MKIENKNILVTGANRGIGAAIVKELLKYKVGKVYAAARKIEKLPDFADRRVVPLALDVTDEAQVRSAAEKAKDVHVLVNNAGTAHFGGALDNAMESVTADMDTNYYGTLAMMRAFVPVLQKNGEGLIASVSSIVGLTAISSVGSYSASKAAVHALIQSARAELAGRNIRVVGIYPGPIDTDMARDFPMAKASVESTAKQIVAGMIAGEEYIFPDPMSKESGALWLRDPLALERQFAARADSESDAA
jgi:NAD(P)-dependent dehydrogenase (short-subunit alcohol dehydrogenase family)